MFFSFYRSCTPSLFTHVKHAILYINERNFKLSPLIFQNFNLNLADIDKGRIVYQTFLRKRIVYGKAFSLFTSASALGLQFIFYQHIQNLSDSVMLMFGGILFAVVTPFLLHLITKLCIIEMYFNDSTSVFTAYTKGLFLNNYVFQFKADDVTYSEVDYFMANIKVFGKYYFVSETDFNDIEVYKHLVGFNKPLKFVNEQKV